MPPRAPVSVLALSHFKRIFFKGLYLGTTKKGIGPTYSTKMNRSGIRVGDLCVGDFETNFAQRFRRLAADFSAAFDNLKVDVEAEIARYRELAETIRPFVTETVSYMHNQVRVFNPVGLLA